jgi:DegV family protein with EDD domain
LNIKDVSNTIPAIEGSQMGKTAVITDTDSSLPADIAEQYGIQQVPITIHFSDESYTSGVDIDDTRLFELIDKRKMLPTTAAPAPNAFASAFDKAFSSGADSIVCICVSSKISTTYNSALSACEVFPGKDITVIDSENVSLAQGFMAITAAKAAQAGASKEQLLKEIHQAGKRMSLYAVLSTLKYLALGGRVGKLSAGMADTFNIKPILTMRDGKLELLEKIRTQKKARERMLELTKDSLGSKQLERVAVIHITNPDGAREFEQQFRASFGYSGPLMIAEFGPGLSVHAGSGVVGIIVQAAD